TQSISEGGSTTAITGLATFTDPAGAEPNASDPGAGPHYTALIHWGDGTTSPGTVVNTGGNNFRVHAPTHTYAEDGTFTVTVDVTHETAATPTVTEATITVNEVQISALVGAGSTQTSIEGGPTAPITSIATFLDSAGAEPNAFDPGAIGTHYTATITWGD